MFPTLFPYGIGGFDDKSRPVLISFQKQAEYYLDLEDKAFCHHKYFIFVALNILQRRAAHLHTSLTVKKPHFELVAKKLLGVSAETLKSVATHLEHEGKVSELTAEEKEVYTLLSKVNVISARIPGSQASKLDDRNTLRSYNGYSGVGHIFLTMNPNAAHSPIFQVMVGDKEVDLKARFPQLVEATERAIRLARDPVAAADFFEFSIRMFLTHLLGWDFSKGKSSSQGGVLGHIRAFHGNYE
ncbi:hypothetical protein BOTBODRAFT_116777, partial [Botryobasidium botryosum FD-172 SS1]